jgi:hypothetical protein
MSEMQPEELPAERGTIRAEPEPRPPDTSDAARRPGASRLAVLWLLAVLIIIIAGVALSPFWAPGVAPLLPWVERPEAATDDNAALAARVAEIEKRPASPTVNVDAVKSTVGALERRVDQLEAAGGEAARIEAAVAATKAGMQQLEQRIAAIEGQSSSQVASEAAEVQKIANELSRLNNVTADLANRLPALEQQVQSQSGAERTDAALALVLLQMREAVDQARPFPAELAAFKAIARDPELAAQAGVLAEAAQNGVASRGVLSRRLAEIAGEVANAAEPPPEADWGAQALARLRGLVTIRRIDGASQTRPEAAVSAAQTALARADLAGAVAALGGLAGANAEAARPWVRMAQERLATEAALDRLRELLDAKLTGTRAVPQPAPAEPSNKARTPS